MKKPLYQEGSLAHFGDLALSKIKKFSESEFLIDRLMGFNVLVFSLVLGISITSWLRSGETQFDLAFFFILGFGLLLGFVGGYFYSFILEPIVNFSKKNLFSLRLSITLLFIGFSLSLGGLLFNSKISLNIGVFLIFTQLLIILLGGLFSVTEGNQTRIQEADFWNILGKVETLITIGTFIVDIALFVIKSFV